MTNDGSFLSLVILYCVHCPTANGIGANIPGAGGGTGLNLTSADTVIHYDPWWNPAAQAQATDRAYRIGQTRPVFVYNLIVAGSVEERMLALQRRKQQLADGLLRRDPGRQAGLNLSERDVDRLFAPITDETE